MRDFRDRRVRARRTRRFDIDFPDKRDKDRRVYNRRSNILGLSERHWEEMNSNTIGWFCTYTPEEIFYAAGLFPIRVIPTASSITHNYSCMPSNLCPYVMNSLDTAQYFNEDFLKGVVIVNSCDAMRKMYDAWKYYIKTPFLHFLDLPKSINIESKEYFKKSLSKLVKDIESHYNVTITNQDLTKAISLCNETRRMLKKLYDFRKQDNPPISGSEIFNIIKASMINHKKEFNMYLESLIEAIEQGKISKTFNGPRILIIGSYFGSEELTQIIESYGSIVVADQLCMGSLYFENLIDTDKDPLDAIAQRYLYKPPCSRMLEYDRKISHLLGLINDNRIDGVIFSTLKFCDSSLFSYPQIKEDLQKKNIPILLLESDGTSSNIGQSKTRIQTFIELIEGKI
ncbi:2-hydroxyacyl-CoA dehydratase subunit D [bacterium]